MKYMIIREQKEKRILMLSFVAGLIFAIVEFFYSIYSHSQSVLMDAVYDGTELIFIALILFLTPLFYRPVSEKYPYGFFQLESMFLIIKGFMMLAVTVSVSVGIIESALSGGNVVDEGQISAFQVLLGLVSVVIYAIMRKMNHSISSLTIDAELLGWKIDIAYSMGMAFAFFCSAFLAKTPLAWLAPYADPVIAVAVIVLTLPENMKMLVGAIKDIFLFSPDAETMEQIKEICHTIMEPTPFTPVFFDIIRTGRHIWVTVYYAVSDDVVVVEDLKNITQEINQAVREVSENCSCELTLSA